MSGSGHRDRTADPDPKQRHRWARLKGAHTLAEVLDWADAEGLTYDAVRLPWVTLHWESAETTEEVAERVAWQERQAERTAAWERQTYDRLREKFDPDAGDWTGPLTDVEPIE